MLFDYSASQKTRSPPTTGIILIMIFLSAPAVANVGDGEAVVVLVVLVGAPVAIGFEEVVVGLLAVGYGAAVVCVEVDVLFECVLL